MENTHDETLRLFADFFRGKRQVNFYPNGRRANYSEIGQILFDEFKNTPFGKKCMKQIAETDAVWFSIPKLAMLTVKKKELPNMENF